MEFDLSLSFREAKGHEKTFRNLFIVAQVAVSFILSIALLYGCGLESVGRKIRSETSGEAIRQSEIHKKSAETKKKEEISRWQNALKAKTENSVWRIGKTEEREGVTHFELVKE